MKLSITIPLCAVLVSLHIAAGDLFDQQSLPDYKVGIAMMTQTEKKIIHPEENQALTLYKAEKERLTHVLDHTKMFDVPTFTRIATLAGKVQEDPGYQEKLNAFITSTKTQERNVDIAKAFRKKAAQLLRKELEKKGIVYPEGQLDSSDYPHKFVAANASMPPTAQEWLLPGVAAMYAFQSICRKVAREATAERHKLAETKGS